jgi:hypothetical protein
MAKKAMNLEDKQAPAQEAKAEQTAEAQSTKAKTGRSTKLPILVILVIAIAIALYLLAPAYLNNHAQNGGQHYGAQLSTQEQEFANAIAVNRTDTVALFNMIDNKLNSTNQMEVSYSGDLSITLRALYTNLTYQLPFYAKYAKYGSDSRVDLYGNMISTLLGAGQSAYGGSNSNITLTMLKINGTSYVCVSGISIPNRSGNKWCETDYSNTPANTSYNASLNMSNQSQSQLQQFNSTYTKTLLNALNETSSNVTEASYMGNPCDFVNDKFSTSIERFFSALGGGFQALQPTPVSSSLNSTGAAGNLGMCLSYQYYVPLNFSMNLRIVNKTANLYFGFDLNETAMSQNFPQSYVTTLPAPLLGNSFT